MGVKIRVCGGLGYVLYLVFFGVFAGIGVGGGCLGVGVGLGGGGG